MADETREQACMDYFGQTIGVGAQGFLAGYDAAAARAEKAEAELANQPRNELLAARKAQREAEAQVVALKEILDKTHYRWRPNAECDACRALADTAAAAEATRKRIEREAVATFARHLDDAWGERPEAWRSIAYETLAAELAALEAVRG